MSDESYKNPGEEEIDFGDEEGEREGTSSGRESVDPQPDDSDADSEHSTELSEEEGLLEEWESFAIPDEWRPLPIMRVWGIPKGATEEELQSLLEDQGIAVHSVAFDPHQASSNGLMAFVRLAPPPTTGPPTSPTVNGDEAEVKMEVEGENGHPHASAGNDGDRCNEDVGKTAERIVFSLRAKEPKLELLGKQLHFERTTVDVTLFLSNLPSALSTDAELRADCERHGSVERAFIVRNPSGASKGYGIVEYTLPDGATACRDAWFKASEAARLEKQHSHDGERHKTDRVKLQRAEVAPVKTLKGQFSTSLYVDNLVLSFFDKAALNKIFSPFGQIDYIHLPRSLHNSTTNRGFAFVGFKHSFEADAAYRALDGTDHPGVGRFLVSFANPSRPTADGRAPDGPRHQHQHSRSDRPAHSPRYSTRGGHSNGAPPRGSRMSTQGHMASSLRRGGSSYRDNYRERDNNGFRDRDRERGRDYDRDRDRHSHSHRDGGRDGFRGRDRNGGPTHSHRDGPPSYRDRERDREGGYRDGHPPAPSSRGGGRGGRGGAPPGRRPPPRDNPRDEHVQQQGIADALDSPSVDPIGPMYSVMAQQQMVQQQRMLTLQSMAIQQQLALQSAIAKRELDKAKEQLRQTQEELKIIQQQKEAEARDKARREADYSYGGYSYGGGSYGYGDHTQVASPASLVNASMGGYALGQGQAVAMAPPPPAAAGGPPPPTTSWEQPGGWAPSAPVVDDGRGMNRNGWGPTDQQGYQGNGGQYQSNDGRSPGNGNAPRDGRGGGGGYRGRGRDRDGGRGRGYKRDSDQHQGYQQEYQNRQGRRPSYDDYGDKGGGYTKRPRY